MADCGRKPVEDYASMPLNGESITKLAGIGATWVEIADFFDVGESTLKHKYARSYAKGLAVLKFKLRGKQLKSALHKGNTQLLIWLGKQILGQAEKIEQKTEISGDPINIVFSVENADKSKEHE